MPFEKGHKHAPTGPRGPRKKKFWEPDWDQMDAYEKATEHLKSYVADNFPSRSSLMKKVIDGKASLRSVIKAKCLECCTFSLEEVYKCTAYRCPIWKYRPMPSKTNQPEA